MYKIYGIILVVIIVGVYFFFNYKKSSATIELTINNNVINAELAITPAQKTKGLMGRKELGKDKGMLFVFDKEKNHIFWMANTYIPLDIIWIDKDKKIVDISYDVQPCKDIKSMCKTYSSKEKSMYVLEVNTGYAKKNNIKIGDRVVFDIINL